MNSTTQPCIGVFDSGLGGLSILKEIQKQLPETSLFYIADQAHIPYGKKDLSEIREYAVAITRFLVNAGSRLIVIACNTASAAALKKLRRDFPSTLFVGMEPALKPAAMNTRSGIVGVLATPATFEAEMFHSLLDRFAHNIQVLTNTAPGLVEAVEAGELDSPNTRAIIESGIKPMIDRGADTIVLGCTHFPLVHSLIQDVAGAKVKVIDPAPAIARRTAYLYKENHIGLSCQPGNTSSFATSGDVREFRVMIEELLGVDTDILQLHWRENDLSVEE
jgi:glutamate racemase